MTVNELAQKQSLVYLSRQIAAYAPVGREGLYCY